MTLLESKDIRDNHNIDTYERGFAYAALLLRASNTDSRNVPAGKQNKYFQAVRIVAKVDNLTQQGIESTLTISVKLPFAVGNW